MERVCANKLAESQALTSVNCHYIPTMYLQAFRSHELYGGFLLLSYGGGGSDDSGMIESKGCLSGVS